jgi:Predicted acetyltransferase
MIRIRQAKGNDAEISRFINEGFTAYSAQNEVALNYEEFCFVAENEDGTIVGVVIGHAYYNEVRIGDLIVDEAYRRSGVGSGLVAAVANAFKGAGYDILTLTTFGFQAPDFYKKLGFEAEFIRENSDPKLCKYFFKKEL